MCPYDCEYYARLATRRMCTAWKILHRTFKAFKPPVKRSVVRKEGVYGVAGFHGTKLLGEDIVQNPCVSYKNMAHEVKSELRKVRLQWLNSSSHHLSRGQFNALFHRFCKSVVKCSGGDDLKDDVMLVASQKSDVEILRPHFLRLVAQYYPEVTHLERLREISDLSSPAQWFPAARKLNRRFIYHSGPTNSGKTHEALQKFSEASSGIYCAPLRMLAAEIYLRCNEENVPCDLLTGEERVLVGEFEAPHLSCTVEMASTSGTRIYDVGIIDEIQMLADEERGSAWTRVILGLNAREIHLCGNSSAVSIVERMLSTTGESLEVRQYDRLSPLIPSRRTLNHDYKKVKEGDCVVAFSRMKIFNIKKKIEALTGLQCAVIYGGLPPVTRVEQAKLFNDPDSKYKVLVASDAIGMGLNLNIKRMVFTTLEKSKGRHVFPLSSAHVKQIAGRAGRYLSQYPRGEVTTLRKQDFRKMVRLLDVVEDDIEQAGLSPNFEQIQMFSRVLPTASLDEIFDLFEQLATLDGLYFLCDFDENKAIVRELKEFNMSLYDLYTFSYAPIDTREEFLIEVIRKFAYLYSEGKCISYEILHLILKLSPHTLSSSQGKLKLYEIAHEVIGLYLWLGMRYPEHFPDVAEANNLRTSVEKVINHSLHSPPKSRDTSKRRGSPSNSRSEVRGPTSSSRSKSGSPINNRSIKRGSPGNSRSGRRGSLISKR